MNWTPPKRPNEYIDTHRMSKKEKITVSDVIDSINRDMFKKVTADSLKKQGESHE